jgi:PAS domain S-box-containing protein
MPPKRKHASLLPLKPEVFLTLVVLSEGEAHGYRMRKEVERRSRRALQPDAGTFYRLLRRLIQDGLIAESGRRDREDLRRRYYRLSALGKRVVADEANRMATLIADIGSTPLGHSTAVASPPVGPVEQAFGELIDSLPDLVWQMDREGCWTYLNAACEAVYGVAPATLIGKNFLHHVPLERQPGDQAAFNSVLDGHALEDYETVHLHTDGSPTHLSFAARPICDVHGSTVGARGTARVVTERVRALEALEAERREAERASQSKSAFLANMSHEIRTPMNGVLGMVELLADSDLTPEQRRSTELVRSSADSLLTILNDILDFSKIEAGRMELEDVPFDLHELATNTVRMFAAQAAASKVELVCDVPPDVPRMVRGDPGRLRQVLHNLVSNAVKFTTKGEVTVSVDLRRRGRGEATLAFSVRDTGVGIPHDRLDSIFEEFTQADASVARTRGGTGLGLPISRQLVRLMGSDLTVTSDEGQGSEFRFQVSLQIEADIGAGDRYGDLEDKRILVVDDNPTGRRIVLAALAAAGAEVRQCDSADAAIAAMLKAATSGAPYDIAIIDGYMPGTDGFEMAELVRRDPNLVWTRLMMLTSAGQRGDGTRARDAGISAYLTKPVSNVELLETTAAVLARPGGRAHDRDLITRHSIKETREHLTILLAEDNPVNQQVATTMLTTRGHTVDIAENGRQAVEAVKAKRYDLVLMDVQMPELDGLAATGEIRNTLGMRALPIVALTAWAMPADRDACLRAGMNGFITKPIKPHELLAAVEGWAAPSAAETAPSPEATESVSQPVALEEFFQMMKEAGVEEMAAETLTVYLRDTPTRVALLEEAVRDADQIQIEAVSHSLKSASGSIRAVPLAELLRQMEAAGKAGDIEGARELLRDIREEYAAVQATLKSVVEE